MELCLRALFPAAPAPPAASSAASTSALPRAALSSASLSPLPPATSAAPLYPGDPAPAAASTPAALGRLLSPPPPAPPGLFGRSASNLAAALTASAVSLGVGASFLLDAGGSPLVPAAAGAGIPDSVVVPLGTVVRPGGGARASGDGGGGSNPSRGGGVGGGAAMATAAERASGGKPEQPPPWVATLAPYQFDVLRSKINLTVDRVIHFEREAHSRYLKARSLLACFARISSGAPRHGSVCHKSDSAYSKPQIRYNGITTPRNDFQLKPLRLVPLTYLTSFMFANLPAPSTSFFSGQRHASCGATRSSWRSANGGGGRGEGGGLSGKARQEEEQVTPGDSLLPQWIPSRQLSQAECVAVAWFIRTALGCNAKSG